jgi:hypothetical protein
MNTAREQKEANTVEKSTVQLETRLQTVSWRNNPCSQPSRAIMPVGLGSARAFNSGLVPV